MMKVTNSKSMIVINARFLTQPTTGVQRYAYEICNRLPEEIGGLKVVFVAPKSKFKICFEGNKEVRTIGNATGQLWEQLDLPLFLIKNNNPLLINFVGIAPLFYKNKVMFLYDLAFMHHPEWFSFMFQRVYNFVIPINTKNSKFVITDSNYVKADICKSYKLPSTKVHVVYAAPAKLFKNLNIDKEEFILTVSSIDPRKNLKRIIKAFKSIDEPNTKLIIVGSKNKTFSNVDIGEEVLNENIIFTGYLKDSELLELYNKAKLFVYASLFEGFGIPPLEAQACGCPCLISNSTSLPEVYLNSVAYCNPESVSDIARGMKELLTNKGKLRDLSQKGFKNVERFSWESSTEIFVKILKDNT